MRRFVVVIALVGLAGCVTPSIPIPPPDPAQMTFTVTRNDQNEITSASLAYPVNAKYCGGLVYVFNRSQGTGIINTLNANCSIGPTTPVAATANDELVISVENDEQTVSTCIVLTAQATPAGVCQ